MFKFIYKWRIDNKARDYNFEILDAVNIIDDYNLWDKNNAFDEFGDGKVVFREMDGNKFFKSVYDETIVVDVFYGNLHIHISTNDTENIYSVRIKSPVADWVFPIINGEKVDTSHPLTETYEVYVWYQLPILDITKVDGHVYRHGSWDKYVCETMDDFFEFAKSKTINSRFNANYKQKAEKATASA